MTENGYKMTNEELGRFAEHFSTQRKSYAESGAGIRALFPRPEPRQDVPSVEELKRKFMSEPGASIGGFNSFTVCARVAHAMMLELAPRQKMEIDGMTLQEIADEMRKESSKFSSSYPWSHDEAAAVAHRLANTPAPTPDPDAEAKKVFWAFMQGHGGFLPGTVEKLWNELDEEDRNGYRAVAAAKEETAQNSEAR